MQQLMCHVPRFFWVRTDWTSSRFGRRFLSLAIESGKPPAESEMYELVMLGRLADESEGRTIQHSERNGEYSFES